MQHDHKIASGIFQGRGNDNRVKRQSFFLAILFFSLFYSGFPQGEMAVGESFQ
ncbi:hypothetical protein N44_02076 [Microcystis aeruginosa NIES-44]|uniref:Uncharacterized protein n=1 Tax=Microcystis aeruginosa NIES-44 TaxID=449439 RepID=A0A0A1VV02_MICAE|nr:hypothetical protein N44_02076 [Microcystis aeruginosa NIES-44]